MESVIELIKKHKKISLFFHQSPDGDALGSTFGMYFWIKENFKDKEVEICMDNHEIRFPSYFIGRETNASTEHVTGSLGIVLDTANTDRILDERWKLCSQLVKIDHHPNNEPYGDIVLVDSNTSSAAELVCREFYQKYEGTYNIPLAGAEALFIGMITDTGRFIYESVNEHTHMTAAFLIKCGVNPTPLYLDLYKRDLNSVRVQGEIITRMKVNNKVISCLLPKGIHKELGVSESALKQVNTMYNIGDNQIWTLAYWDEEKDILKASVRSKSVAINEVAAKYNGGGHKLASGTTPGTEENFRKMIIDLENLILVK